MYSQKNPARQSAASFSASLLRAGAAAIVLGCAVAATPAQAQSFPDKPIHLIVPFPPGGGVDILGRVLGPKLTERLGQPVLPENRVGAGGNVGTEYVAKSRPDGSNLLMVSSAVAISPSLYKKLNYSPLEDFTPVGLVAQIPVVVLVRANLPARNLKEFIDYARANPGKSNYGSSGTGATTTLANMLFVSLTKIDVVHVPYKGTGPAIVGMMSGDVDMVMTGLATAVQQVQTGKVKALGILDFQRAASLPNVPTAKESGIDNAEVTTWFGILAPAGTPRATVNRINAELQRIIAMPDVVEKMRGAGVEPFISTPERFADYMKSEVVRWAKVIKDANIEKIDE